MPAEGWVFPSITCDTNGGLIYSIILSIKEPKRIGLFILGIHFTCGCPRYGVPPVIGITKLCSSSTT